MNSVDGYPFNELADMQMAMVRGLHTPIRKQSHIDTIQTVYHLPSLIVDAERLEELSLLLLVVEKRDHPDTDVEEHVLDHVEENVVISVRRITTEFMLPK
jgi:hypothetical protein